MCPCGGSPADTLVAPHTLSAAAWRPGPPERVHVLQIHGTADTAIPCEAGRFRDEGPPRAKATVENRAGKGCDR